MNIARSTNKIVFLEIKEFDFRSKTVFRKWCSWGNTKLTVEGRYKYDIADIRYEIARVEQAIDSGEFPCNTKNQRYISNLYKELNRLSRAA
ncbi:hypothetical protein U5B43_05845 [Campylobacter sp. 9BO]|uniref:hypothetical protein n=1 Tax=Campylobacter sp. 9BO TaxID=3424759 RepID=UPI003D3480A1